MKIRNGFVLRNIGGMQIVVGEGLDQIDFNSMLSLNDSAAYVWQEIVEVDFDEFKIAELLTGKYDVTEDIALADARQLMSEWTKAGITIE